MAAPQDLFAMLGGPPVLLEVRPRTKIPVRKAWQKLTVQDMTPDYLMGLNSGCNVAVSLGAASRNLITIDFDTEQRWQQMLALNPCFADTLLTQGDRGGNIWLYMDGDFPPSCDIKDKDGNKAAEFRATGRNTTIRGIHQTGKHYTNNGQAPLSKRLEDIVWPDDFILPWAAAATPEAESDSLDAQLIAECGPPIVVGRDIKINHAYFVRRFCLEHHVLFETTEGAFYLYEHSCGSWKYVDVGVIKELIRADWLRIAPALGGNALSVMGTDTLLNQLTSGVRSYAGQAGAFKHLGRELIHVGNAILRLLAL
jgi:Bifunctional DNA primase/polymerase, N-terminal